MIVRNSTPMLNALKLKLFYKLLREILSTIVWAKRLKNCTPTGRGFHIFVLLILYKQEPFLKCLEHFTFGLQCIHKTVTVVIVNECDEVVCSPHAREHSLVRQYPNVLSLIRSKPELLLVSECLLVWHFQWLRNCKSHLYGSFPHRAHAPLCFGLFKVFRHCIYVPFGHAKELMSTK